MTSESSLGSGSSNGHQSVVLHTSWRGRVLYGTAPLVLTGFGLYGVIVGGFQVFNTVLLVIGVLLIAASLFDFPIHTTIGPDGIERRCLGRTDRLGWHQVTTIARPARGGISKRVRDGLGVPNSTGLVAEIETRPSMLIDRIESPAEFDAVQRGLATWCPTMVMRASRPADGIAPTWMYKRRVGAGDGLVDVI